MNSVVPPEINPTLQHLAELLQRGAHADAVAFASRARRQFPVAPELIRLHAIALLRQGRRKEAAIALNRAAELAPGNVEVQCNLASFALEDGKVDAAIERLRSALQRAPGHPAILHGLGTALMAAARYEQAREAFAMATHGAPEHPGVRLNLATAELELGHAAQAKKHIWETLQLAPTFDPAYALLGHLERTQGHPREAANAWLQAERLAPQNPQYPFEAGLMLDEAGELADAADAYSRALRLDANIGPALSQLLFTRRRLCDWHDLDELAEHLRLAVSERRPGISPFALLAEDVDAAAQHQCATTYAAIVEQHTAPLRHQLKFLHSRPAPDTPVRVGFVADGFNEHATGLLVVALFEALIGSDLELHLFATTPDNHGPIRRRLAAATTLHDVSTLHHAQTAQRIYDTGIEILFDLNGYCGKDNTELMALSAAPVQVNWLAYPGTSGAPWMDYMLTDAVVVPNALRAHVSEKVLRLPRCFQPNDNTRVAPAPPMRSDCGLPEHGTVFACFNNSYKLNPTAFARLMLILQQVPDSILWLLNGPDGADDRLRAAATYADIKPERLVFMARLPHADYLARYAHVDLFLDTLPYNAHTTASDALWMGCPVLTSSGSTFAGRVAASLLYHLGLPELICEDDEAFIAMATQLGNDREALATLRWHLANQCTQSPLFDMHGFAADFRRAVHTISARYRIGRPPTDLNF